MSADPVLLEAVAALVARQRGAGLFTLGICGAQGSGKTTLVADLAATLEAQGLRVASLSLDDLYLTRAERQALAHEVHPLFATRGVPGTHDVALGLATLDALARGEPAPLPRFDKACDDRAPPAAWPQAPAATEVLLFEGWCLGARPQDGAALVEPANALERDEDREQVWRSHTNAALDGDYRQLFGRIDRLVFLAAPSWDVVAAWREQQEAGLRTKGGSAVMDADQVGRFIQHYERLTRHMLATMPDCADLTVRLDPDRAVLGLG